MFLRLTTVIVMCVGSMFMCVSAQSQSRVVLPRDYGVKLCGREFIRAVIFTCGGSRWKRSLDEDLNPLQVSSYPDITEGGDQLGWQHGLEVAAASATAERSPLQLPSSSSSATSLADLLVMLAGLGDRQEPSANTDPREGPQKVPMLAGGVGEQGRSPALTWPQPNKRKRNFSLGVAGMCCNQGCTKNDIGRLC